jgi:SAM-dependent methyltransferase
MTAGVTGTVPPGVLPATTCRICHATAGWAATRFGAHAGRDFQCYRCGQCGFIFVGDPVPDPSALYDEDYYVGKGADPLVNYVEEVSNPRSPRHYEWRGIEQWVSYLTPLEERTWWLDFGAGSGGLVHHLRSKGYQNVYGYDTSTGAPRFHLGQDHWLDETSLDSMGGRFAVISAIEVLEHLEHPVVELERLARLLSPGGLLVVTTTNAAPYRSRLHKWRYVIPEIHISFYEPPTLSRAMHMAGLATTFPGYVPGWKDIIRYKALKNLGIRHMGFPETALPWSVISRAIDSRLHLSAQPVAWKEKNPHPSVH